MIRNDELRFGNNAFYGRRPDDLSLANALEAPTYDGNGHHASLFEDSRKVQVLASHRYISSTERYRETNLQELKRAVARFHPLDREKEGG